MRHGLLIGVALLAVVAVKAEVQTAPAQPPGTRFVDLDGHRVRVQTLGLDTRRPGQPLVVFEAGASNALEVWSQVVPEVAAVAPLVAYDRAGLGQSDWDRTTPTPQHAVTRLHRVLEAIDAKPPYVLAGYSWGGVLARYFAGSYAADVAGLVLVDPAPIVTDSRAEELAPFDSIGAGRSGYDAYWSTFGKLLQNAAPAARAEFDALRQLMSLEVERRDLKPLPAVPIVIIVAASPLPLAALQLPFDTAAYFEAEVRPPDPSAAAVDLALPARHAGGVQHHDPPRAPRGP